MHFANKTLLSLTLSLLASAASAATVTGTVTGPDGKPFMGAFVVAENPQNQDDGERAVERSRAAITSAICRPRPTRCRSRPSATRASRATTCSLPPTRRRRSTSRSQKSKVRWSDLSTYQGRKLLPKTKEHDLSHKDELFTTCFQSCHSFQKRMATETWDENGWRARVIYMRDVMMEGRRFSDEVTEDLVVLLHVCVRPQLAEARIARRPCRNTSRWCVRSARRAMNIAYVEYDFRRSTAWGRGARSRTRTG